MIIKHKELIKIYFFNTLEEMATNKMNRNDKKIDDLDPEINIENKINRERKRNTIFLFFILVKIPEIKIKGNNLNKYDPATASSPNIPLILSGLSIVKPKIL